MHHISAMAMHKKTQGRTHKGGPTTFVVYRGIRLANTAISRAARTRELYEAMKAREETAIV